MNIFVYFKYIGGRHFHKTRTHNVEQARKATPVPFKRNQKEGNSCYI